MTDKVYIVTSGVYSDYHIQAVFLDETEAKAYADACNEYTDVEEWAVGIDPEIMLKLIDKNKLYAIHIYEADKKPYYYLDEPSSNLYDDTVNIVENYPAQIILHRWVRNNDSIDKVVSEISARVKANDVFEKARLLASKSKNRYNVFKLSELFIDI